jgi:hypothetical protein
MSKAISGWLGANTGAARGMRLRAKKTKESFNFNPLSSP